MISEIADLPKIMRPKYLSVERKKFKINLADILELLERKPWEPA